MNKQAICNLLSEKYNSFVHYVNELTTEEYFCSYQQKWTAAQQLQHIVLCVKPLVQVFSMDKSSLEQKIGLSDRPGFTYDELLNKYNQKLKEGGKAPDRYVPETILTDQREILSQSLAGMIKDLCSLIENFTEQELDTLVIPHPLLGNLSMREMIFNAGFHVEHHHELIKQYLKNRLTMMNVSK